MTRAGEVIKAKVGCVHRVGDHHLDYTAGRGFDDGRWTCRHCGQTCGAKNNFRALPCVREDAADA